MVANHGFTYVLREDNETGWTEITGACSTTRCFRARTGRRSRIGTTCATRAPPTPRRTRPARSPQLETEAAIRSWQGTDPFYAYVPFQKGRAGLEDDPATWIPEVKDLTAARWTSP